MVGDSDSSGEEAVREYLERKGSVELLCVIDAPASTFSELAEKLPISRTTLTRRLNEGTELGLVKTKSVEERDTSQAYALTEEGATLRTFLNQSGATEKYRQIRRLQQEFDEQVDTLQDWVTGESHETQIFDHKPDFTAVYALTLE